MPICTKCKDEVSIDNMQVEVESGMLLCQNCLRDLNMAQEKNTISGRLDSPEHTSINSAFSVNVDTLTTKSGLDYEINLNVNIKGFNLNLTTTVNDLKQMFDKRE